MLHKRNYFISLIIEFLMPKTVPATSQVLNKHLLEGWMDNYLLCVAIVTGSESSSTLSGITKNLLLLSSTSERQTPGRQLEKEKRGNAILPQRSKTILMP